MRREPALPEHRALPRYVVKWLLLAAAVALLAGSASALLLVALDWATRTRLAHRALLLGLPLAGFAVASLYLYFGPRLEAGNNLLIDEIHDPAQAVPLRLAPLVFVGTVLSHLFGASVGREGTAVQMGGALADELTRRLRLTPDERRIMLMTGISAGFASVFGTPLAGAIFGLEVLAVSRMEYDAIFPCVTAAVVADATSRLWGIHHTPYNVPLVPQLSAWGFGMMLAAGALFGLTGRAFAAGTHALTRIVRRSIPYAPLAALVGGLLIAAAVWACGADRYIGLGIATMEAAFHGPVASYDFAAKAAFTIASLGFGFKGGEVTPLFFIGATLGNTLAPWLHVPRTLLTGVGFVAVFAGAANTPLASTVMAMELFGAGIGPYAGLACVVSYLFSGPHGIYAAQRARRPKHYEGSSMAASPAGPVTSTRA